MHEPEAAAARACVRAVQRQRGATCLLRTRHRWSRWAEALLCRTGSARHKSTLRPLRRDRRSRGRYQRRLPAEAWKCERGRQPCEANFRRHKEEKKTR